MITPHVHTSQPPPRTSRALARSLLDEALALRRTTATPVALPVATPVVPPSPHAPRWTVERCCTVLRAFVAQYRRLPHQAEWRQAQRHGLPSQWILRKLFGSQNALTIAIGQRPNARGRPAGTRPRPRAQRSRRPYTPDHVQVTMTAFLTRHGRLPTRAEWRASGRHRLPDPGTIRRHYGSRAALYAAMGLVPPPRKTGNQYTHAVQETR